MCVAYENSLYLGNVNIVLHHLHLRSFTAVKKNTLPFLIIATLGMPLLFVGVEPEVPKITTRIELISFFYSYLYLFVFKSMPIISTGVLKLLKLFYAKPLFCFFA